MTDKTTTVTETVETTPEAEVSTALIDQVVEARVEAEQASETSEEALEVAEQVAEATQNLAVGTTEWLSQLSDQIASQSETMGAMEAQILSLQTQVLELTPAPPSESLELSSSTQDGGTLILSEETADQIGTNPDREIQTEIITSETLTEALEEIRTEAHESAGDGKLTWENLLRWLHSPVFVK
jgi:hypothetical protein